VMAASVFIPNKAGMDYVLKQEYGTVGKFLKAGARSVVVAAKLQAGAKTGALKTSIHYTHERASYGQVVKIGSPLPYAAAHHEGTRPHVITGRNGGMLRFTSRNRVIYTRAVMHPGTRPNKYLSDNLGRIYTPRLVSGVFL